MGLGSGTGYPEVGHKSEEKQSNHHGSQRRGLTAAQASSCTSRGWVEDALLPTELTRTEWSATTGFSGLGLKLAKLE